MQHDQAVTVELRDQPPTNPAFEALSGPHRRFAQTSPATAGTALRYNPDVAPFGAIPTSPSADDWAAMAALVGPGGAASVFQADVVAPDGWTEFFHLDVTQMALPHSAPAADPPEVDGLVTLGPADVPDILALIAIAEPGPFAVRTIETGHYLGIRSTGGRLVAMAGERMQVPGGRELSAVCTHPDHRGQGLATILVWHVVARMRAAGELPFLHAVATNTTAIRLYEQLGFEVTRSMVAKAYEVPASVA